MGCILCKTHYSESSKAPFKIRSNKHRICKSNSSKQSFAKILWILRSEIIEKSKLKTPEEYGWNNERITRFLYVYMYVFEFNTSTLLEKALKAILSHFKFEQTFFFCFFFWLPEFGNRYCNHGIKILLVMSLRMCVCI